MNAFRFSSNALLLLALAAGCSQDSPTSAVTVATAAPALVATNGVIAATAGSPITYDATRGGTVFSDPALKGLTYSLSLSGASGTLSGSASGAITGTPSEPGIVTATLTGRDAQGRTVTDQFAIVIFASGLLAPSLPASSYLYADADVPLPAHFSAVVNGVSVSSTDNTPATNPVTNAGATLGRVLFYDTRLSANDGTSCASCHEQALGFGDGLALSAGFNGGFTGRHTPSLVNARFYQRGKFFWDERAPTLEAQVLAPIQNPVEMGMTLDNLVLKLIATPYYQPLFAAAFGSTTITSDRVSRALAQYTRSLVSGASRYDKAYSASGVPNFAATLTAEEQVGEQLFRTTGCASCHTTLAMVSDSVHNIGLDATVTDTGAGRGAVKAPSLRNVAVRTRYMHDGRFGSLDEVVEFFNSGVQANPFLDARLKAADGSPRRLGLTTSQKAALVAFMKALTDSTFLTSQRFANPFVTPLFIPPPTPTSVSVTIQGKAYHPPTITVTPGTTITFTNLDNTRHSAGFFSPAITSTPIFSSGSRSVVMPVTPGTYAYQCAVHGAAMQGTVIVK